MKADTEKIPIYSDVAGDEKLVILAINGNMEALEALSEKMVAIVMWKMLKMVKNREDAEDLTQETLCKMHEKIGELKNPKAFRGWLARIAINERNQFMRKKANNMIFADIEAYKNELVEEKTDFVPSVRLEDYEVQSAIMDVVSVLPPRQKEALMLHYYDGLSVTETASVMDIPHQSVSNYLSIACKKLKDKLTVKGFAPELNISDSSRSVGIMFTNAFARDLEMFIIDNDALLSDLLIRCTEAIAAAVAIGGGAILVDSVATTSATTALTAKGYGVVVSLCAALVAGTVGLGLLINSEPQQEIIRPTVVQSSINFSGGESFAENYMIVNPTNAAIDDEVMETIDWWIVHADTEERVMEGEGADVKDSLLQLQNSGKYGEFVLYMRVVSKGFYPHIAYQNFMIVQNDGASLTEGRNANEDLCL